MDPVNTVITVLPPTGKNPLGNIQLEGARFFGRPNFSGVENQFKDSRRQFNAVIPNDVADQLRALGWNVKTLVPTPEEKAQGRDEVSFIKVMIDIYPEEDGGGERGSKIYMKVGDNITRLKMKTIGVIDRARITNMVMEIRAWMYNQDEVDAGEEEPKFSARLVEMAAEVAPSLIEQKYGMIGANVQEG